MAKKYTADQIIVDDTVTTPTLIQISQASLKGNIKGIVKDKAKVIPFKEYTFNNDVGSRKRYGVLAEDIEVDYPELVHIGDNGIKGVNYIDLLIKRVAELEKELADIELTPGTNGSTGSTGPKGSTGSVGGVGAKGNPGTNGSNGAKGSTGSKGNTGAAGTNGKDAPRVQLQINDKRPEETDITNIVTDSRRGTAVFSFGNGNSISVRLA